MLAAFDHEEHGAQELMGDSDDGTFVTASHDERLELRLEDRLGFAGGMSELAEQTSDIGIAFSGATGSALSR